MTTEEENHLLSMTNPARISPRIYLSIPDAIIAIEEELNSLLRPDVNGLPTLITAKSNDARTKGLKRLFTTMVVKRKSTLQYKARLCLRGDLRKPEVPLDFSAPTASRCSPRLILSLSVNLPLAVGLLDISSAFTQSNLLGKSQRCLLVAPWYIPLPWKG